LLVVRHRPDALRYGREFPAIRPPRETETAYLDFTNSTGIVLVVRGVSGARREVNGRLRMPPYVHKLQVTARLRVDCDVDENAGKRAFSILKSLKYAP